MICYLCGCLVIGGYLIGMKERNVISIIGRIIAILFSWFTVGLILAELYDDTREIKNDK